MTEEKEFTEITKEVLARTANLKESTKKSMIVGEVNIIRGIIIFETILKEINPTEINSEVIKHINDFVDAYMTQKEDLTQKVDNRIHQGISLCYMILHTYNKEELRKKLQKEEKEDV